MRDKVGLFSSNKEFFGLDIGNTEARVVQLQKNGTAYSLVSYGSISLPPGLAESDGKIDMQNLAGMVKKLLDKCHISTKNIVTALPGSSIFAAVVKIPLMNKQELDKAVRYQAEQNIPLKLEEVKIDWQVVKQDPVSKQMSVMIVAAPALKVNRLMNIIEYAGLDVEAIETSSIAVARSFYNTSDPLFMIVDFGSSATELTVVENGMVSQVRSLPSAGNALTRSISHNLGLDPEQAEQFKMKFGLSQEKLEGQVYKSMKPILANVIDEIERSIKFYTEEFGSNISNLVLTGGSARIPELISFLKANLNLDIQIGNPWSRVSYQANIQDQLQKNSMEFSVAVGLAMREN